MRNILSHILGVVVTALFFSLPAYALQGDSLFNAAIGKAEKGQLDEAVRLCLDAAKVLEAEGKLEDWVAAHSFAASCALRSPTYSLIEVRELLEKAIEKAPMEQESFTMGRLQLYYGWFLSNRLFDFYRAKIAYEKTKTIVEKYAPDDTDEFVTRSPGREVFKPLAQIYIQLGESEKALALMELALADLKKNGEEYDIPELFADWGILHHDLGQDQLALSRYQDGINALESAFGNEELDGETEDYYKNTRGLLLSNQAQSLLELGDLPKASLACKKALDLLSWEDYRASALSVMGHIIYEREGSQAALIYFEEAIAEAAKYFPYYSRRIAKIENELARLYRELGEWEKALTYAHKALSRVVSGMDSDQWAQAPDPELFYPENTIMEALTEKGVIFKSWYDQSGDPEKLALARQQYDLAIQMEEVINRVYTYQSSMLSLAEQSHARHEAMMEIIYEGYQQTKDPAWVEEAFAYTEKSRALILNRALANDRAIRFAGDEELFRQEKALQAQLVDYQRLLFELRMEKADTHQIASVNREIFQLKDQYDKLINSFEEQNERYYQLRHDPKLASVTDVQASIASGTLFIEYFLGKESNRLFLVAISKDQPPQFIQKTLDDTFDEDLTEFIRRLKDWNFVMNNEGDPQVYEDFVRQSHQFYQLLFPSVLKASDYERIVLVPDGQLNLLPFDVLLTKERSGPLDYAGLDYLIKNAAIHYAFSATIMLDSGEKKKRGIKNYLGIAPDYTNSRAGLSPVRNNQRAVGAFRDLLKGSALLAEEATIAEFLSKAAEYRILHFYGHAKAYPSQPMSSWLAFTSSEQGPIAEAEVGNKIEGLLGGELDWPVQDLESLLFMFELYNLDLNAELAVLSACETGAGKIALGEGVISLARAFRYAGCPSTLMSLWEANDFQGEVAFLMEAFFKNLKEEKMSKDEAIRQAKLTFLSDPKKSSYPAYWASFVMIGDNSPVVFNDSNRLWWVFPLLIVGIVLGSIAGRIR